MFAHCTLSFSGLVLEIIDLGELEGMLLVLTHVFTNMKWHTRCSLKFNSDAVSLNSTQATLISLNQQWLALSNCKG